MQLISNVISLFIPFNTDQHDDDEKQNIIFNTHKSHALPWHERCSIEFVYIFLILFEVSNLLTKVLHVCHAVATGIIFK